MTVDGGEKDMPSDTVVFQCAFETDREAKVLLLDHETGRLLKEVPFEALPWHGDVRQAVVTGVEKSKTDYVFAEGEKIVIDPRARVIRGREHFGSMEKRSRFQVRCSFPTEGYDWGAQEKAPAIPPHEVVAYGLHVRYFTRHSSSGAAHKGTFTGLKEKIGHLRKLGVNQVILMPCYEFEEIEETKALVPAGASIPEHIRTRDEEGSVTRKLNCWGFTRSWYFAPKAGYCATDRPDVEFKDLIRSLHAAGIELVMEFAFPDEVPEDLALEALRFWTAQYHVDGFWLFCRPAIACLAARDPYLTGSRLLTGYFEPGQVLTASGKIRNGHLFNCNDGFKTDARRLLKGDADMLSAFTKRVRQGGEDIGYVNYMTSHDGFTLMDLVSYDRKHNEENGEDGRDGAENEFSWNCGAEGPTRKRSIQALRLRQIKNAFAMLILAQGTPMIRAGDELGNSQGGNNNPYCIDSPQTWVEWSSRKMAGEICSFVARLIRFRKEHPILCGRGKDAGRVQLSNGYPDFSCHSEKAWYGNYEYEARHVGLMFGGIENGQETFIYAAFNLHWDPQVFALPHLPEGLAWKVVLDTGRTVPAEETKGTEPVIQREFTVPGRTVVVLISTLQEWKTEG